VNTTNNESSITYAQSFNLNGQNQTGYWTIDANAGLYPSFNPIVANTTNNDYWIASWNLNSENNINITVQVSPSWSSFFTIPNFHFSGD